MAKAKNQYQTNLEIEQFIKDRDSRKESYSRSDIDFIQLYEGSGGQISKGAKADGSGGILHEFYTPEYICELMYKLAQHHGYDGGQILEPSIATGRMISAIPDKSKVTGFEINPVTHRICQISYPEVSLYNQYFETAFLAEPNFRSVIKKGNPTWLKQYPFSLVIGNPPYGKYKNRYSKILENPKFMQIEHAFMYYGIKLLKKNGLLIYITGSNFMRNSQTYNNAKKQIGQLAELIDAYRLPKVFKTTEVNTDILIFRRK